MQYWCKKKKKRVDDNDNADGVNLGAKSFDGWTDAQQKFKQSRKTKEHLFVNAQHSD